MDKTALELMLIAREKIDSLAEKTSKEISQTLLKTAISGKEQGLDYTENLYLTMEIFALNASIAGAAVNGLLEDSNNDNSPKQVAKWTMLAMLALGYKNTFTLEEKTHSWDDCFRLAEEAYKRLNALN